MHLTPNGGDLRVCPWLPQLSPVLLAAERLSLWPREALGGGQDDVLGRGGVLLGGDDQVLARVLDAAAVLPVEEMLRHSIDNIAMVSFR